MRLFILTYTIVVIWVFGWLAATFGFLPSLFAAAILIAPAFITWRMVVGNRPIQRRECAYASVLTTLAIAATAYLVMNWYSAGIDRLARLDREFIAFRSHIAAVPEYKDVDLSYTDRKGGRVYMHGIVPSRYWHDRLIQDFERMVRSNDSGYFDGVEYPGKAKAGDT